MTDHIFINDLRVKARVGVSDEERSVPQDVLITVEIAVDLSTPGRTDDLTDTVDYGELVESIAELVETTETRLLESLAERIIAQIATNRAVAGVSVQIVKDDPPVARDLRSAGVRLERTFA